MLWLFIGVWVLLVIGFLGYVAASLQPYRGPKETACAAPPVIR